MRCTPCRERNVVPVSADHEYLRIRQTLDERHHKPVPTDVTPPKSDRNEHEYLAEIRITENAPLLPVPYDPVGYCDPRRPLSRTSSSSLGSPPSVCIPPLLFVLLNEPSVLRSSSYSLGSGLTTTSGSTSDGRSSTIDTNKSWEEQRSAYVSKAMMV